MVLSKIDQELTPDTLVIDKLLKIFTATLLLFLSLFISNHSTAVTVGQTAPATQLESIRGDGVVTLKNYRGKVVLVDFWASWCPPCLKSLPLFKELRNEIGEEVFEVFAINVDEDKNDGIRLFNQFKLNYVSGLDPEGRFAGLWNVQGMPTSFLIDQNGVVRMVHTGFKEKDIRHFKKEILNLLKE